MNNNELPEYITRENYEFVMFNLLEGLYDQGAEEALLSQIEKNPLFRFEWEQWKKSRIAEVSIPDLGDEAYWNSVKSIASDKPAMVITHRRKTLLRVAAVLLPLLIGAGLLWLNNSQTVKTKGNQLVNSTNSNKKSANAQKQGFGDEPKEKEQPVSLDKGIVAGQNEQRVSKNLNIKDAKVVLTSDTTVHLVPRIVVAEKSGNNNTVGQQQKPGNEVVAARKKRFSISVNEINTQQSVAQQTASTEVKKTGKLSRLFVNPQIKKFKTESGEVWIEIIGDGETIYAKAADSVEK